MDNGPGPWGGPWTGSMGRSMDPGPCFVYVQFKRPADLLIVCLCVARCGTRLSLPVCQILTFEHWEKVFKSKMASTQ